MLSLGAIIKTGNPHILADGVRFNWYSSDFVSGTDAVQSSNIAVILPPSSQAHPVCRDLKPQCPQGPWEWSSART